MDAGVAYGGRMEALVSADERLDLAQRLAAVLSAACPGSEGALRGSLAAGTADDPPPDAPAVMPWDPYEHLTSNESRHLF